MGEEVREDLLEDCQSTALGRSGLCEGEFGLASKGAVHAFEHALLRMHGIGDRHSFDFMEFT